MIRLVNSSARSDVDASRVEGATVPALASPADLRKKSPDLSLWVKPTQAPALGAGRRKIVDRDRLPCRSHDDVLDVALGLLCLFVAHVNLSIKLSLILAECF